MGNKRQMHLGMTFHAFGCHRASWRHPDVATGDMTDFDLHLAIARKSEEGLFDFLFMADSLVAEWGHETPETLGRQTFIRALDPCALFSAIAPLTQKIGLIASINTTYSAPFLAARTLATLDHISGGRAGWNLVTGGNPGEAANFGDRPHPEAAERYERAEEFAEIMFGLWDSWEPDAFVGDKASGRWFDPERMHRLDHKGKYFSVAGPLIVPRTPQGRPVTVQAGNSDAGRELAAATADIVFSVASSIDGAKAFFDDVKGRMGRYGRAPEDMLIMPGAQVFVGRTEEEAAEKLEVMNASYDMVVALHMLGLEFGTDMSVYPLDGPVPDLPARGWTSRGQTLKKMAADGNLTLRQLAMKHGTLGHWILTGTPKSIADTFEAYMEAGAADGFMIQPPYMMGALNDFVDLVVPELQRRGIYRTCYEGRMLRDHLGLKVPTIGR